MRWITRALNCHVCVVKYLQPIVFVCGKSPRKFMSSHSNQKFYPKFFIWDGSPAHCDMCVWWKICNHLSLFVWSPLENLCLPTVTKRELRSRLIWLMRQGQIEITTFIYLKFVEKYGSLLSVQFHLIENNNTAYSDKKTRYIILVLTPIENLPKVLFIYNSH